jgi:hypothetical protein
MDLTYPNWAAIGAVVGVSDAHIVGKNGTAVNVHFAEDKELDGKHKKAQGVLQSVYDQSWVTHIHAMYHDAPRLSKAVMRVPTGVDFCTFDVASNVVDKPFCFSAETFEAIMASMFRVELGFDQAEVDKITNTNNTNANININKATTTGAGIAGGMVLEGMDAALFAPNWASALSSAAGFAIPYRADGRTALLPTGLKDFSAESWLAEACRAPFAADDCDGSAAFVTSAIMFVNGLFDTQGVDPTGNRAKYPHLYGMYRSFVHYEPSIAVLGANAAHAGDSGKGSMKDNNNGAAAPQVAGHAMVILIPKLQLLTALYEGSKLTLPAGTDQKTNKLHPSKPVFDAAAVMSTGAGAQEEHFFSAEALAQERLDAFYPQGATMPLPQRERQELLGASWAELYPRLKDGSSKFATLKPLAIEGTAPADSRLHTPATTAEGRQEAQTRHKTAQFELNVANRLSPSVAAVVKTLDSGGPDHKHAFYSKFVELVLSLKSPAFTKSSVQRAGQATAHIVLANVDTSDEQTVSDAGVTPENLHGGKFVAIPLWQLGAENAAILASASDEVRANTLARRRLPVTLHPHQSEMFAESCAHLDEIEELLKANAPVENAEHATVVISYSALVHNPQSMLLLKEMIRSIDHISGQVDRSAIPGLAVHSDDSNNAALHDAGLLVTLDLSIPSDM